MLTNHSLVIVVVLCVLVGAWGILDNDYKKMLTAIVVGALCGLSLFYNLLSGQPLW